MTGGNVRELINRIRAMVMWKVSGHRTWSAEQAMTEPAKCWKMPHPGQAGCHFRLSAVQQQQHQPIPARGRRLSHDALVDGHGVAPDVSIIPVLLVGWPFDGWHSRWNLSEGPA
jgi:hypothetical protein